jgi:hypothetical protein
MAEYKIKDAKTADINEIFFDKNTNKMSYKNYLGIVTTIPDNVGVQSVVAGTNITVDNTNPANPIISASGGGGGGGIHLQRTPPSGGYGNLFIVYASFTFQSVSTNRLYLFPFIPNKNITIQSLTINVSTLFAGGLAKILIYSDVSGLPTTKLYESADLDCSTTGIKTATTSQTFIAGTTYWIGFIANNSTNNFYFYGQGAVLGFATTNFSTATNAYLNTTFASIPNTLTSVNYASGNIPAVILQNV